MTVRVSAAEEIGSCRTDWQSVLLRNHARSFRMRLLVPALAWSGKVPCQAGGWSGFERMYTAGGAHGGGDSSSVAENAAHSVWWKDVVRPGPAPWPRRSAAGQSTFRRLFDKAKRDQIPRWRRSPPHGNPPAPRPLPGRDIAANHPQKLRTCSFPETQSPFVSSHISVPPVCASGTAAALL